MVLSVPFSDYIPWTSQLQAYFDSHYVLVSSQAHTYVYNHFDRLPTDATQLPSSAGRLHLTVGIPAQQSSTSSPRSTRTRRTPTRYST